MAYDANNELEKTSRINISYEQLDKSEGPTS